MDRRISRRALLLAPVVLAIERCGTSGTYFPIPERDEDKFGYKIDIAGTREHVAGRRIGIVIIQLQNVPNDHQDFRASLVNEDNANGDTEDPKPMPVLQITGEKTATYAIYTRNCKGTYSLQISYDQGGTSEKIKFDNDSPTFRFDPKDCYRFIPITPPKK